MVLIACKVDVVDVLAVFCTCGRCRDWDNDEFWKRVFAGTFGAVATNTKRPWKHTFMMRHHCASLRLDPTQTFGGTLHCEDKLFVASAVLHDERITSSEGRQFVCGDNSGWQLSRLNSVLDKGDKFYFEVELLWTNPRYGDIVAGLSNVAEGVQGTLEVATDSCPSGGFCFSAARSEVSIFSNWKSSWNMGPTGPGRVFIKPRKPLHVPLLYPACTIAWNRRHDLH